MVVAKASKMSWRYRVAKNVAGPLGVGNVEISPTVGKPLTGEVARSTIPTTRDSPPSTCGRSSSIRFPYGGDDMVLEVAGGASAIATNTQLWPS